MGHRLYNVSRRDFLKTTALAGSGLVLGTFVGCKPRPTALIEAGPEVVFGAVPDAAAFSPNVFMSIETSGDVYIVATRSEMGQGIRTGLPAVVADELEADWTRVKIVQATGDPKYGDQNTDGSRSIVTLFQPMREAGAAAREMLVAAAAQTWGVPVAECAAENHTVVHRPTGRTLGYGALAATAATLPVPEKPVLKTPDRFRYIGRPLHGVDNHNMVTGRAVYGIDATAPGMLYASIERCPVLGGTVRDYDAAEALKVPGVRQVVELDPVTEPPLFNPLGGLAVIAENTWAAMQGRARLQVTWDYGKHATFASPAFRAELADAVHVPGKVMRAAGDVTAGFAAAAAVVEADYYVPFLAHAPMEPPSALARVEDDACEVWACVQDPQTARTVAADLLGLDPEKVTVHVTLLGGAFGRKSKPDFVGEAVLLSKAAGAPVKVTWTREDEIRHDYYHAASAQYLKAGVDAQGMPVAWLHRSAFPSIGTTFDAATAHPQTWELAMGASNVPFDIPHLRCEAGAAQAHVRIGWVRSVCNIHHSFAVNSFVNELAAQAGRDPRDYLLDVIGAPRTLDIFQDGLSNYGADPARYPYDTGRLRRVIEVASGAAGWGRALPEGRGLGVAAQYSFLTYVAQVVDASVDDDGRVTVHRVDCAVDCGTIVNPDRVRAQMEGAVIFGLSLALYGNITVRDGAIEQGNFDDYPLLRLAETPEIHIHLIESTELPGGVGEPGLPPVAPALTNAIFAASGRRIRELPVQL